jgi:hypothetical protein
MIINKTTLRAMLAYLEIDECGVDAVQRILRGMSHEEAISCIWTLLALIFPEVDATRDRRAVWETWLQDGIVGPIAPIPDSIPDFGGDEQ